MVMLSSMANELQPNGINLGICTCAEVYSIMDKESGETCFYYFLNMMGYFMQKITNHGKNLHLPAFMHYMWIIHDHVFTDSFIVLCKCKKENQKMVPWGRYVKLVICVASLFKRKIILLTMNFRFPILLFYSKGNPILVSQRCILMGVLHF